MTNVFGTWLGLLSLEELEYWVKRSADANANELSEIFADEWFERQLPVKYLNKRPGRP
jgi:hypothetical protein